MYKKFKRILDLSFSLILIIILIPLFILIPIFISLSMGVPIFFIQTRIGMHNKPFRIFKYRTMRWKNAENKTDEQRITWIGRILRLSRLDELPQLYNILKGDMSFIGPRPLLPEYLPYYKAEEIRRHYVRPGLSGYSQIHNLNYPDWEIQFASDLYYVNNISFKLDLYIFLRTLLKILKPGFMVKTGISGGRLNFDIYRKLQWTSNEKMNDPSNFENKKNEH